MAPSNKSRGSSRRRNNAIQLPPWAKEKERFERYLFKSEEEALTHSLHCEILDFVRHVDKMNEQLEPARMLALSNLEDAVKNLWPEATISLYGSFATGTCLPGSDIDVVVFTDSASGGAFNLHCLASELVEEDIATSMQILDTASIPVLKYTDIDSGIKVDCCFNVKGGVENAAFVREQMKQHPELRPLALVIKCFLAQHGLNMVFTGGISSHAVILLIISFLQFHPSSIEEEFEGEWEGGMLGLRLLNFFRLYGMDFDYETTAVSVLNGGGYLPKAAHGWGLSPGRDLLAIEDPVGKHNVSAGSFNVAGLRRAFCFAYEVLNLGATEGLGAFLRRVPTLLCSLISPSLYLLDCRMEPTPTPPLAAAAAVAAAAAPPLPLPRQLPRYVPRTAAPVAPPPVPRLAADLAAPQAEPWLASPTAAGQDGVRLSYNGSCAA